MKYYKRATDGTRYFERPGFGYSTLFHEIEPEEYNKYAGMTEVELSSFVDENLVNDAMRNGYGYYGATLYKDEDGVCFLGISVGNSCD